MPTAPLPLDDRWLHGAVTKLRASDALTELEDRHDVVGFVITRGELETALGRALDNGEWRHVRGEARQRRAEVVATLAAALLAGGDGPPAAPTA